MSCEQTSEIPPFRFSAGGSSLPLLPVWRGSALFYDRSGVGNHGYSLFGGIAAEMEVNGRRVELSVLALNLCEVSCSLDERVYGFISNRFTISISYLALNPAEEIHTGIGRDGMAFVRPPVCRFFWGRRVSSSPA